MPDYPSRKLDQFVLRLPDGMRDRIKQAAEQNGRSMNAEIVATLDEKYPHPEASELEAAVNAARADGKPRDITWLGERARVYPLEGGGFRVMTLPEGMTDFPDPPPPIRRGTIRAD